MEKGKATLALKGFFISGAPRPVRGALRPVYREVKGHHCHFFPKTLAVHKKFSHKFKIGYRPTAGKSLEGNRKGKQNNSIKS